MQGRLGRAAALGLATGLLGVGASLVPWVLELEERAGLDWLFVLRGPLPVPSDVTVVSIDAESAEALGLPSRPDRWPRSLHGELIDRLASAGAEVIAFDIMFNTERSFAEDQAFAQAADRAGNVLLLERLRTETIDLGGAGGAAGAVLERREPPIPPLKRAALASAPFPLPVVPVKVSQFWTFGRAGGDVPTLPTVALQAYALPVYERFVALLRTARPQLAASLPATREELVRERALEKTVSAVRTIFNGDPDLRADLLQRLAAEERGGSVSAGSREHALLRALIELYGGGDSRYLNYYGPQRTIPTVPYHEVLKLSPESPVAGKLRGKAVFVGFSERQQPEQQDAFYSVFSERSGLNLGGVEIGATAFSNLLEMSSIRPLGTPLHLLLVMGWGFAAGALMLLPTMPGLLAAAALGPLYVGLAAHQLQSGALWLPLMVPLFLQLPVALFGALAWKYARARAQAERIQRALGYYLPTTLVQQLARDTVDVNANAQLLHGTCLVTDAEQYTALSEALSPEALRALMNDYYQVLFRNVEKHGGFVSDIVGDSMVAIWATAEPDSGKRSQACEAALEMLADVQRFNRENGQRELPTRIGLHSGELLLGSVGARSHFEYRALGDIVNTASRIQGLNKQLGTRLLVSEAALERVAGAVSRELGEFRLAGKKAALVVHELTANTGPSQADELRKAFAEALASFKVADWDAAATRFRDVLARFPGDGPSSFYLELCEERAKEGAAAGGSAIEMREK